MHNKDHGYFEETSFVCDLYVTLFAYNNFNISVSISFIFHDYLHSHPFDFLTPVPMGQWANSLIKFNC